MSINKFYFKNGLSLRQEIKQSEKIVGYAKRDLTQLQPKGVTIELIEKLEAKAQALEEQSFYGEDVAKRKELTTTRNESIKQITDEIEMLRSQLRLVFSTKTGSNDALFTRAMSRLSVDEFINLANETLNVLKQSTDKIAIYGVTAEVIADFESQIKNLIEIDNNQVSVAGSLVNSTFERSELRREVHELLQHISIIGKTYWKRVNPAMSKNYIIRKIKISDSTEEDIDDVF